MLCSACVDSDSDSVGTVTLGSACVQCDSDSVGTVMECSACVDSDSLLRITLQCVFKEILSRNYCSWSCAVFMLVKSCFEHLRSIFYFQSAGV
jgi:hypothetical protein